MAKHLSQASHAVIRLLAEKGPLTVAAISESVRRQPATVASTLYRLRERNIVSRKWVEKPSGLPVGVWSLNTPQA